MPLRQNDITLLDDLHALRRLEGSIDHLDRMQPGASLQMAQRLRAYLAQWLAVPRFSRGNSDCP